VQKVRRSLPSIFDPKISAIGEIKDLNIMTMDKLHGILTTYEMRIEKESKKNPQERKQPSRNQRRQRHKNTKQVTTQIVN
jgi:hypothetical protein